MRYAAKHTVALDWWAYEAIDMEIGDGLESGGVLLGTRAADGSFRVTDSSGPGGSLRAPHAIRHDRAYYARVEAAQSHTGARALGIWHEHPDGTKEPSETDLRLGRRGRVGRRRHLPRHDRRDGPGIAGAPLCVGHIDP